MAAGTPSFDYRARLHLQQPAAHRSYSAEGQKRAGLALLAASIVLTGVLLYAIVISKLLPPTGISLLDSIRDDRYYCLLIPLSVLPTIAAVYSSWVSLKFFRTSPLTRQQHHHHLDRTVTLSREVKHIAQPVTLLNCGHAK